MVMLRKRLTMRPQVVLLVRNIPINRFSGRGVVENRELDLGWTEVACKERAANTWKVIAQRGRRSNRASEARGEPHARFQAFKK